MHETCYKHDMGSLKIYFSKDHGTCPEIPATELPMWGQKFNIELVGTFSAFHDSREIKSRNGKCSNGSYNLGI